MWQVSFPKCILISSILTAVSAMVKANLSLAWEVIWARLIEKPYHAIEIGCKKQPDEIGEQQYSKVFFPIC